MRMQGRCVSKTGDINSEEKVLPPEFGTIMSSLRPPMSELCKYCGREYRDARSLLINSCSANPNGRNHELFEGDKNGPFLCVHCGRAYRDLRSLVINSCSSNPNGRNHEPFEGNPNGPFVCKFCGREYRDLRSLVINSCSRNPERGGHHSPAR